MVANDTHFSVNYSRRIVSPTDGGVVFPISRRLPYGDQLIGWVVVSLSWRSPTLITPFLNDVKNLIDYNIDKFGGYDSAAISQIVDQIKQRFIDWQIGLAFIFPKQDNLYQVYINQKLKAYVISSGRPFPIQSQVSKELTKITYKPTSQNQLIITRQQLPPNLNIVNLKEFVKTLKHHNQLFFILYHNHKKPGLNRFGLMSAKQLQLFKVIVLAILLAGLFLVVYSGQPKQPNQAPTTKSQASDIQAAKELDKIKNLIKTDPANAARQLERLTASLENNQMTDTLKLELQQLRQQLNQADTGLFLAANDLTNPRLKQEAGRLYLIDNNQIFLLSDLDKDKLSKRLVVKFQADKIIDATEAAGKFFVLTNKAILLKTDDQVKQILRLPKDVQPARISTYLDNIYLISLSGQVFKYDKGAVNYPVKPRLYFTSNKISQPTFFLVNKKIYILTKSGDFYVFYFGKQQRFNFEKQIEPIIGLSYDWASNRFWFVNRSGFGAFDSLGKIRFWHKQDNNYRQITTTDEVVLLEKDGYLKLFKLSEL